MLPRISKVECNEADYLLFSTNDVITNYLFKTGHWEEHILEISKFFLDEIDSPLVLDIGANLGAYSIPLAKHLLAKRGTVMGFEPQKIIYYQLCGNIVLNRLDNYDALNCAVGDRSGEIEIPEVNYDQAFNIGGYSIDQKYRELNGTQGSVTQKMNKVRMIALDDLEVDRSPSLIKMDVEGYELMVLKGANRFLEKHRFPPILFEAWGNEWFVNERQELLLYLMGLGYEIIRFGGDDYVAQHPLHGVQVNFFKTDKGSITMSRER